MRIIINEEQFKKACFILAEIGVDVDGMYIAHHKTDSTDDSTTWIEYWKDQTSLNTDSCLCPSCMKRQDDLVGGHVETSEGDFIVPVCRECNSRYKGDSASKHPFYVERAKMVRVPED